MLLAVARVAGHVRRQVTYLGGIGNQIEKAFGRFGYGIVIIVLSGQGGGESIVSLGKTVVLLGQV